MNTSSVASNEDHFARIAYTTPEAAAYLGLAVSTLNKWRCYGSGPKFLKLGRSVRYRRSELDQFVETRILGSTQLR